MSGRKRTMIRKLAAATLAVSLLAAGCGGDDDDDAAGSAATAAPPSAASAAEGAGSIELADTSLGQVIVDAEGMTLYLFVADGQGESTCYDECEASWPVLEGEVSAGEGLDSALVGTTTRTNGDVQATYNGWPLYYFSGDAAVGDTKGQGLRDVWYVVDAGGDAVEASPVAADAPTTTRIPGY